MHSAMAVWTSIIPTRLQVRNRDCIKSLPVSAAESTAQLPVVLWQHLPNEGDSGSGSTWCCFTWVSAVMQQNHMKMSSLFPETQFCQHYLQGLGANKEKNRNRARLEFTPLYTIIRLRKVCKIQGELSLENTFCLRDCCNVLAELSEKICFSTITVSWIGTLFLKISPALAPIRCVFTPLFTEAVGLPLSTHQTLERYCRETLQCFSTWWVYTTLLGHLCKTSALPSIATYRDPENRSSSIHSVGVMG